MRWPEQVREHAAQVQGHALLHPSRLRPSARPLARVAEGEYAIHIDDFNLNVLKDTCDYSCFLARLDEYRHLMTYSPGARRLCPRAVHVIHRHLQPECRRLWDDRGQRSLQRPVCDWDLRSRLKGRPAADLVAAGPRFFLLHLLSLYSGHILWRGRQ